MCWGNWTHGFYYPFAQGSSRFSWWEAMKREVKMARIQDTTSISMPGLESGAQNRQVRIWLLCLTPIFSVLFLPTIFLLFLVLQYDANTCSLQMAAWRDWGLRLTTDLWPLTERGNAPIEGMRPWCWKSISLPPTSSKREVTDLLSSPIWTRVPLQTLSWVKPWFMSEVHFCVGLEPVQVFLACACHQWSKVAALARISTLCQGSKRRARTPTHKGLLNGAKSRDFCRPWSKRWWKRRTCVAQNTVAIFYI